MKSYIILYFRFTLKKKQAKKKNKQEVLCQYHAVSNLSLEKVLLLHGAIMCCLRNQVDKGKFEAPSWRGVKLCGGTANARVYSRPLGVHGRQLRSCPSPKPLVGDLGMRVFLSCLKSYPPFTVLVHSCVFHLSAWIFVGVLSLG